MKFFRGFFSDYKIVIFLKKLHVLKFEKHLDWGDIFRLEILTVSLNMVFRYNLPLGNWGLIKYETWKKIELFLL
jgi:hypothetical protein